MIDVASIVAALCRAGVCAVGRLPPEAIAEAAAYLADRPIYRNAHVPQTARNRGEAEPDFHPPSSARECYCVHTDDAVLAPHLLEAGLSLIDVASEYLGAEAYVYSANAFWTLPGAEPERGDIQEFHIDADDERFLALFTYLTDVLRPDDGAHQLRGPDGVVRTIIGTAGTAFLADTRNEHRGLKPRRRERGIHWLRFSANPTPPAYVWDGLSPMPCERLGDRYPSDPRLRRSLLPLVTPPSGSPSSVAPATPT